MYLDYNATAPLRPEVSALMAELLAQPLNASSMHGFGREAKKWLEEARKSIADVVSAWSDEVVFVASGSEANALALRGVAGRRVLASAVEHSSVKAWGDEVVPVTQDGVIDLAALEAMLLGGAPALVSVMPANNETGVIQPVADVAALCRKYGALLHCDAVQGLGKMAVDFGALGADMMTLSGHKCGGPLGAAALVVRRGLSLEPLIRGGGQELGRRAGTENIAAIAGFALAAQRAADLPPLAVWRDVMEARLAAAGGVVFGAGALRLCNTTCVAMPGVSSEVQLMKFDLKGMALSAGSACSSGRIEPSPVLAAMGVAKQLAACAVRISTGWGTAQGEVEAFSAQWERFARG